MQKKHNAVLFLNLYAFSLTGGIEKVSRNFIHALSILLEKNQWTSYSMYDQPNDLDTRYTSFDNYKAFQANKLAFIFASYKKSLSADTIILSHINLLIVARLIALFNPKKRFILFAHGIEVWETLTKWKTDFIKKKVEVWAVSEYTKQQMIKKHDLSSSQIQVVNNSLSPFINIPTVFAKPEYLLERYHLNINEPILYTLGRLSSSEKYKGYDSIIKALAKLKQRGLKFYYLLAGKADDSERLRIEELISAHKLNDQVTLIGYLHEEELTPHFQLSDIFIMPSKGEGFGIVFIEAAACGCQIIGGNTDGSTDALLDGRLGQMINPDDIDAVAKAIEHALQDKQYQPQKQQQLAIKYFSFKQYVNKIAQLLSQ